MNNRDDIVASLGPNLDFQMLAVSGIFAANDALQVTASDKKVLTFRGHFWGSRAFF